MDFNINTSCLQCKHAGKDTNFFSATGFLDNEKTIIFRCPNDHETIAFNAIPRYSLYFNKGISSYLDGYYYEAFGWIYTALEVFRKEFVKATMHLNYKIDLEALNNTFDKQFKSSERIYGAYASAFLLMFGKHPEDKNFPHPLENEVTSHRNDLFHSGKIISKEELQKDCYAIYCHMIYVYHKFSRDKGPAMLWFAGTHYSKWYSDNEFADEMKHQGKLIMYNSDIGAFNPNSLMNVDTEGDIPEFDELLERVKQKRLYNTLFYNNTSY